MSVKTVKPFKEVWDSLPYPELKKNLLVQARRDLPQSIRVEIFDFSKRGEDQSVDHDTYNRVNLTSDNLPHILTPSQRTLVREVGTAMLSASCLQNETRAGCVISLGGTMKAELTTIQTLHATLHWNGMAINVTHEDIKDLTI